MSRLALILAGCLALSCSASYAEEPFSLWDGFVVVHGSLSKDGGVLACRHKGSRPYAAKLGSRCLIPGFLKSEVHGQVEKMTLQEILEVQMQGELESGQKARVVGAGPGFGAISQGNGKPTQVTYCKDLFVLYYRLAK